MRADVGREMEASNEHDIGALEGFYRAGDFLSVVDARKSIGEVEEEILRLLVHLENPEFYAASEGVR